MILGPICPTLLLVAIASTACLYGQPQSPVAGPSAAPKGTDSKDESATGFNEAGDKTMKGKSILKYCEVSNPRPVYLLETKGPEVVTQDLLKVDGLNIERDITVVICLKYFHERYLMSGKPVTIRLQAFHKPKDGDWRDINVFEDSPEDAQLRLADAIKNKAAAKRVNFGRFELGGPNEPVSDPIIVIPLRRQPTRAEDLVRVLVTINEPGNEAGDPNTQAPSNRPPERAVDATFRVDRFGIQTSFFDSMMAIQRWGEDRANQQGKGVVFDSVNFRPAPGINYGFTYYHRRRALLRFLEPGFGANLTVLNWNDRLKFFRLTLTSGHLEFRRQFLPTIRVPLPWQDQPIASNFG